MPNKISDRIRKYKHKDCLNCQIIPCIDFYYRDEKGSCYGELVALREYHNEKLYPPCHLGGLIYVFCKFVSTILSALKLPGGILHIQCVRDLKTIAFLILTGHYRIALSALRGVIEMFLAGMYFDKKYLNALEEGKTSIDEVQNMIIQFVEGKFEVPEKDLQIVDVRKKKLDYGLLLEWHHKMKYIDGKTKNHLQNIIGKLNRFIHGELLETIKPECPKCPAMVKLSRKEYEEAAQYFQEVVTILLFIMVKQYIKPYKIIDEEVFGCSEIFTILENLERELGTKMIFSNVFRKLGKKIIEDLKALHGNT